MTTPDGPTGSTVPRRQLGRYLTELRQKAGITAQAASKALERSPTTIWRVEKGHVSSRGVEVRAMCDLYDAPRELTEGLVKLALETKAKGWWHSYDDVMPEGFDLYIGLEEAALRIDWYEPELVPGLLQTEDYAREIIRAGHQGKDPEEIERRVQLRVNRRISLTRVINPPALAVILGEPVLRHLIGGTTVMARQLAHLADVANLPNVTIQVVPANVGFHQGLTAGQFQILRFPLTRSGKETEPPTVYADGYTGDLYLDRPNEVERYDAAFQDISSMALGEEASRRLILEMAEHHDQA
ncbi:helix-turn-helix domain-containing protein [Streptomyces sp. NPDC052396]|uniref:helix-turn-helix domain-containing protein n=1 Tax=Streptomyces sp. NPDC052396 TaxID=3365689 RepID=UPI0037D1E98D